MKIPEIPTDNLYKFLAIAGISLIIAAIVGLIAVLSGPDKLIESAITAAQQYVALVDKQEITETTLTTDETSKLFSLEADVKSYIEILDYRKQASNIAFCLLWITAILGIIVASLGFFLWYLKLQKFLDAELKNRQIIASPKKFTADE